MDAITLPELDRFLVAIVNDAAFTTFRVHLFSNNLAFDSSTTLGALVEAAWSGYGSVAVTGWSSPSGGSGGTSITTVGVASWAPGSLGFPEINYGWYVTDGSGNLVGGGNFSTPLQMGGTTISLDITISLTLTTP